MLETQNIVPYKERIHTLVKLEKQQTSSFEMLTTPFGTNSQSKQHEETHS